MKYIIFSFEGEGFPIAEKLLEENQEVIFGQVRNFSRTLLPIEKKAGSHEPAEEKAIRLKRYKNIIPVQSADALLEKLKKIKNPEDYFIFFDTNYLFYYAEQLQDLGFKGNFPTKEDRRLEIERIKAKEFVKKYYPLLSDSQIKTIHNISEAKEFLSTSDFIWVLKSQSDDIVTFVPQTNDVTLAKKQVLEKMETFYREYGEIEFLLEKRIDNVIEVTPEKFYYDGIPLCMTINLENKFFGSGNIGEQVGCAGDLVFPVSMKSKIHDICFPPIVDELAKKHKGLFIWDASLLIDPLTDKIYFGEFCSNRPGYNSIFTEIAQAKSVHSFFEDIVHLKNPLPLGTFGASLMVFNINRDKEDQLKNDIEIVVTDESKPHSWPYDVYKKTPAGYLLVTGYDKHLTPITGTGPTILDAVNNLYRHVEGFQFSGAYYRPKFDFLSKDYSSSIMNRLDYCLEKKLFIL